MINRIRSFLRVWSHLLKKSLMENFSFCAVVPTQLCPWLQKFIDTWSPAPVYWHSGFSSHPYEVVEKAKEVVKCYGYGQNFANDIAFNLVIKYIDRINQGNDSSIYFIYNSDFTPSTTFFVKTCISMEEWKSCCQQFCSICFNSRAGSNPWYRARLLLGFSLFGWLFDIHQCFFLFSFYKPYNLFRELFSKSVDIIAKLRAFTCLFYQLKWSNDLTINE